MKKIAIFAAFAILSACQPISQKPTVKPTKNIESVAPLAYYSDWDRAVRADADMQNMFVATPRKITKPIDMYMAMALSLKYNYTKRLSDYRQAILKASKNPQDKLPEIISQAGYINVADYKDVNADLKVAWNILDVSSIYFQSKDNLLKSKVATEEGRKVIHNLLQETRSLYWKTLTAQKLLPIVDEMIEFLTLEVDELNIKANQAAKTGEMLSQNDLQLKRKYMNAIKELSILKRDFETSEIKLASLLGFHPNTEYKLVGKEYGNFDLPVIKNHLSQLEWVALTNRPELRLRDFITDIENIKIYVKEKDSPSKKNYLKDPQYYNRMWSKKAKEVSMEVFEEVGAPSESQLETLRRHRLTNIVLNQVYVAWARYVSALEDYQISQEIAFTSEDIAQDVTITDGINASKSALEASVAIADEVKAMSSYVELQDSLGNLYVSLGLDAIPNYMLGEPISRIAVYLRGEFENWHNGAFLPDKRPYLLDMPAKRPPLDISSQDLLPDIYINSGDRIDITIPQEIYEKMNITNGDVITKAGLRGDRPLPSWLNWNEKTHRLSGIATPTNSGTFPIRIYIADKKGNIGYINFVIYVKNTYVPSIDVSGMTKGRKVEVLKPCNTKGCLDDYVETENLGIEVETGPKY